MSFITNLNWRYATKKFDPTKEVSIADKEKIIRSIKMAPSSFGLQPFCVFVVTNVGLREKLKAAAWGQPQLTDSAFVLVFCSRVDMKIRAKQYFELVAVGDTTQKKNMSGHKKIIENFIDSMDVAQTEAWANKQLYIALGFSLAACAELRVDSCPMEGFDKKAFDRILNLPRYLRSQVILAVGQRLAKDTPKEKVRFSKDALFTFLD